MSAGATVGKYTFAISRLATETNYTGTIGVGPYDPELGIKFLFATNGHLYCFVTSDLIIRMK